MQVCGRTFQNASGCAECDQVALQAEKRHEEERRAAAFVNAQRIAEIPIRYRSAALSPFPLTAPGQKEVLAHANAFVSAAGKNSPGLVLVGKVGSGKTYLACAILNAFLQNGLTGQFLTVMQALRRIKETWVKDSEKSEQQAIRTLIVPDLLILDEVGVQLGTEIEHLHLSEIVNGRYNAMRPTILISNLTMPEFTTLVGERVVDRFREGGTVLVFDWPSLRHR